MTKVYVALALCTSIFFMSCFKSGKEFELPQQKITSDTLVSGSYWNFNIGDSHADVYQKAQELREEKSIKTISVVNNVFTNLAVIKNKLPLYHALFLDATTTTPNGVQLYFENGKVKSIYNNAGQLLSSWPWTTGSTHIIRPEDEVSTLYDKLVAIKDMAGYSPYFERLSMFYKDVATAYDVDMDLSSKWLFSSPVNEKVFLQVNFKFKNNAVDSIMVDRVETL